MPKKPGRNTDKRNFISSNPEYSGHVGGRFEKKGHALRAYVEHILYAKKPIDMGNQILVSSHLYLGKFTQLSTSRVKFQIRFIAKCLVSDASTHSEAS